jgi:hypothetical protein
MQLGTLRLRTASRRVRYAPSFLLGLSALGRLRGLSLRLFVIRANVFCRDSSDLASVLSSLQFRIS